MAKIDRNVPFSFLLFLHKWIDYNRELFMCG